MDKKCNGKPVWSKHCAGVSSGRCYIYEAKYLSITGWSLSPEFCTNAWMTTCQLYGNSAYWKCENHPKNNGGKHNLKNAGWPWEENRWVNNWWSNVKMSCFKRAGKRDEESVDQAGKASEISAKKKSKRGLLKYQLLFLLSNIHLQTYTYK